MLDADLARLYGVATANLNEAPRSKAPRYLCEILRSPSTLLRQGYGGFSSPSSSQQAARYSAKENKAVKRNIDRFPADFVFRLTVEEASALRFQSGISKVAGRGGR